VKKKKNRLLGIATGIPIHELYFFFRKFQSRPHFFLFFFRLPFHDTDSLPVPVAAALAESLRYRTLLPVQKAVIPVALDLFSSGAYEGHPVSEKSLEKNRFAQTRKIYIYIYIYRFFFISCQL
jgi:hypothetical protein